MYCAQYVKKIKEDKRTGLNPGLLQDFVIFRMILRISYEQVQKYFLHSHFSMH